ncbi:MAG: preprotein translocase subunit YajC [Nocardioidaceae bacterium]|nr:preprotein translocase subunit YajC [Nocardioidaceae bacterium]
MQGAAQLLPVVVILILAYLLMVRLPRKRAREVARLQAALSVGDQVMLTSGIFARVRAIVDEKIDVEIAPEVVVTVHQGAIGQIVRDRTADDDDVDGVEPLSTDAGHVPSESDSGATGYDVDGAGPADGEPGRRGV